MTKKLLTLILLGLVCSVGNAWADTTLFDVDFTDETSVEIKGSSSSAEFISKTYDSYSMSFGVKSSSAINITNKTGLTFTGNNFNTYCCLAIPLTLIANKKVTATITLASSGKVSYKWVSGPLPSTPNQGSGTAYSTSSSTNTLEYTPTSAGSYVLYLGRSGASSGKVIESIVITQETSSKTASSASFAVTAPSITLPGTNTYTQSATTAAGYDGTVSYALSNNTCGATIEGTTVTVTKAGSVKVTATAPETTNFDVSSASYTLTVTDPRTEISGAWSNDAPIIVKDDENPTIPTFSITTDEVTKGTHYNVAYSIVSDDEDIISIDENGISEIITSKEATATVRATVTVADGHTGDYVASTSNYDCVITVLVPVDPTITFNTTSYKKGSSALDLSSLFTSNSAGAVTYSVTDADGTGATISSGTKFSASTALGVATVKASQAAAGQYKAKEVTTTIVVTDADWIGALSSFTRVNDTYTYEWSSDLKTQNKTIYVEIPSSSKAGSISLKCGSDKSRYLYIYKTNGTVKDDDRKIEMKTAYQSVSFTSSDILTEAGKHYLVFSTTDDYKPKGIKYTISSISGTIPSIGWSSFSSPCPLDLNTLTATHTATAYYASAQADNVVTLTSTTAKVPAGEGLLIRGTAGEEFTISTTTESTTDLTNLLTGTTAATPVEASSVYVLAGADDGKPYFQLYSGTSIAANKAYIASGSIGAPDRIRFIIEGEENATGLDENSSPKVGEVPEGQRGLKLLQNGQLRILRDGITYDALGRIVK